MTTFDYILGLAARFGLPIVVLLAAIAVAVAIIEMRGRR